VADAAGGVPGDLGHDARPGDAVTEGAEAGDASDAALPPSASPLDADEGSVVDSSELESAATPATPRPGDVLITEVMFDPSGNQPLAEWFEVYNAAPTPERLDGLTIRDGYPHEQLVAAALPVVVPPQGYAVLVRDRAVAESGQVPSASILYDYGGGLPADQGIILANGAAGDLSLWDGATLLADVPYGPWSLDYYGASIELAALRYEASNQEWAWCAAPNAWGAATDFGTPGAPNDCP
jgi:hypothetical protein